MSDAEKKGRTIFVGNIDWEITEDRVIEELSKIGTVKNFRLLMDKNTGRSKGYGFCEYESYELAQKALRTLKISFNGRPVKINYAENDLPIKNVIPEKEEKKDLTMEQIVKVLDEGNNSADILTYFKSLAVDSPAQLKTLLGANPNLTCAIMNVLLNIPTVKEDATALLMESLDPFKNRQQIESRMTAMTQKEMDRHPEEVKNRLMKLKFLVQRAKMHD